MTLFWICGLAALAGEPTVTESSGPPNWQQEYFDARMEVEIANLEAVTLQRSIADQTWHSAGWLLVGAALGAEALLLANDGLGEAAKPLGIGSVAGFGLGFASCLRQSRDFREQVAAEERALAANERLAEAEARLGPAD